MRVRSLGLRSDLMLRSFAGEVVDLPEAVAVRTPSNPTFRWGNFMLFPAAPKLGDLARWTAEFRRWVGGPPEIVHLAFTWDEPDGDEGDVAPFLAAGFDRFRVWAMTARSVVDPRTVNTECEIRDLRSGADFEDWLELAVAQNDALPEDEREGAGHTEFARLQGEHYRRMIEAGWGRWFGAYVDGRLASSLGLFVRDGLGRFQMVDTHPQFRRQGLAGTLLVHAAREGLATMGARELVITADADDVAKDLYLSVGFATTERYTELTLADASEFSP